MPFEQIVVIGTGPLACECVAVARATTSRVSCIEPEEQSMSRLPAICRSLGVDYRRETDRAALGRYFETIRAPTLVVSAYNMYIFPTPVIENRCLLLVNFHNSLLPRHRGRNAPTWAIFDEDTETGVTWHLVQSSVDAGDIVMRTPLAIAPLVTAVELTRQTLELGGRTFKTLLPRLWSGDYQVLPQGMEARSTLNKSTDFPNGGVLDLSWGPHRISALLRSVDYGGLPVFPSLKVFLHATEYRVGRYTIVADPARSHEVTINPPKVEIHGDGLMIRLTLVGTKGQGL
jgi:methionyl-tRNA formyltransferase